MEASIYVRISDDQTGQQAGVQRQEQECRELCERRGWAVREVFVDNDLSATTGKTRPAFERLLASSPQAIVCWHTDRLVRLTGDLERVIDLGVNVHALHTGHLDLSTPAGRAVARTVTAWAQYEGEQKAERQKSSARQRAAAGKPWWPRRPFGLEMDGTLHREESAALREVYRRLLAGASVTSLAAWLNAEGFRTNTSRQWSQPSLRQLLLNPRNAAIRTYDGVEVGKAAWQPVVAEDVWRAAVRLLTRPGNGGGGSRKYLLSGLATCAVCGASVRGAWRGTRAEGYRVYECKGRHCISLRGDLADDYARFHALRCIEDTAALGQTSPDTEGLEQEATALRSRLEQFAEDYADGTLTKAQVRAASERVKARLTEVEDALVQAKQETVVSDEVAAIIEAGRQRAEAWDALGVAERRGVLSRLFESVELQPVGRGVRTLTPLHVRVTVRGDVPAPR